MIVVNCLQITSCGMVFRGVEGQRGRGAAAAIYKHLEGDGQLLRHCSSDPGGWTLFLMAKPCTVVVSTQVDKEGRVEVSLTSSTFWACLSKETWI